MASTATSGGKVSSTIGAATRAVQSRDSLESIGEEARRLADNDFELEDEETHEMGQMGAKRIGSLAIGIAVVGLVMNELSSVESFSNSSGVIDVNQIFQTAGSGLQILVVGVIIAAAAVLLNLWSGF